MAKPSQKDMFFALRALSIMEGLTRNESRVAGALLAHFNHTTGECDPSVDRLARLLGIGRATVLAATARLSEGPDRLFDKDSHGGHANRAQYTPRWTSFHRIVNAFDAKFMAPKSRLKVRKSGPSTSENLDVEHPKPQTQTHSINPLNEPLLATDGASGNVAMPRPQGADEKGRASQPKGGQGHGNGNGSSRRMDRLTQSRPLPRHPVSHSQAADTAATRRWYADLQALGADPLADAIERLTQQTIDAATAAERHERGAGIRVIRSALWMQRGAGLS
ncbi:UNVERIFIED_ORG: hypothetical protein GGD59_005725 [Rhizobium esperanzae]